MDRGLVIFFLGKDLIRDQFMVANSDIHSYKYFTKCIFGKYCQRSYQ